MFSLSLFPTTMEDWGLPQKESSLPVHWREGILPSLLLSSTFPSSSWSLRCALHRVGEDHLGPVHQGLPGGGLPLDRRRPARERARGSFLLLILLLFVLLLVLLSIYFECPMAWECGEQIPEFPFWSLGARVQLHCPQPWMTVILARCSDECRAHFPSFGTSVIPIFFFF